MKKIIDPGREPVIQYSCDGCKRDLYTEESPLEVALEIAGNFPQFSVLNGLIFDHIYCIECGEAVVRAIESTLKIEIKAGDNVSFACDIETCNTDESSNLKSDNESEIPSDVREGWL